MNESTLEIQTNLTTFPDFPVSTHHHLHNTFLNETNKGLIEDQSLAIDDIESRQNLSICHEYPNNLNHLPPDLINQTAIKFDNENFEEFEHSLYQNDHSRQYHSNDSKEHYNSSNILELDCSSFTPKGNLSLEATAQENNSPHPTIPPPNDLIQSINDSTGSQPRQNEASIPSLQRSNSNTSNLNELLFLTQRVNQEVKALLFNHIEFYFFVIVTYFNLILIFQEKVIYFTEFPILWGFAILQIRKLFKSPLLSENLIIQRRKNRFILIDWLAIILYLVGVSTKSHLENRESPVFLPITAFCVLPTFNIIYYSLLNPLPSTTTRKRKYFMAKRIILWCQLWLISLKLDSILNINWNIILSFALVILGAFVLYSILPLVIFLILIFLPFRRNRIIREAPDKTKIIGFGWSFMVSLFSVVWFILILGLQSSIDSHHLSKFFTVGIIIAIVHNALLIAFTFLGWSQLQSFLNHLSLQELYTRARQNEECFKDIIRFEIIDPEIPYLVMISPTFHQLLQEEIKNYSQEEIKGWRDQIFQIKMGKYQKNKTTDPQLLEQLEKEKEKASQSVCIKMTPNCLDLSEQLQGSKLYYSFDDMDILGMITKRPAKRNVENDNNENLCYICVEKVPNAIVMNCGHGGLCYECAIESWRKGNKCVMCRSEVDKILKVNFYENINISKPVHGARKIIETKLVQAF